MTWKTVRHKEFYPSYDDCCLWSALFSVSINMYFRDLVLKIVVFLFQKAKKDQAAVVPYYPSGSLVDGVAAALITHVGFSRIHHCDILL